MKCALMMIVALACVRVATAADLSVPFGHPTIQGAIEAASDFDVVVVNPGTYVEHLDLMGKQITVRSIAPTDPSVVAATIVDGGGAGPIVTCTSGETQNTSITGLTFTNGGGPNVNGGAMYIEDSDPTIRRCVFVNNICTLLSRGGAIYCRDAAPEIAFCDFEGNQARYGGAIRLDITSNAWIHDCRFENNLAVDDGGAISKSRGQSAIERCVFLNNSAGLRGGALYLLDSECFINDCSFSGNHADLDGGAAYINSDQSDISGSDLVSNTCGLRGGAVYVTDEADCALSSCDFRGNVAGVDGGGVYAEDGFTYLIGSDFCGNQPNNAAGSYVNNGSIFQMWCFNFVPEEWLWFDPFEWDDVLTGLDYELLARVTFEDAAVFPGKPVVFDDPLNVLTDNGVFEPCAVPPFVCIKSNVNEGGLAGEAPRGADGLMAAGEGYMDLPAVGVMPSVDDDGLDIVLLAEPMMFEECYPPDEVIPGAAIGIQYCALSFGEPLIVSLYDQDDVLIGNFEVFPKQSETAPCGFIGIALMNGQLTGTGERTRIGRVNIWSFTHEAEAITELIVYGFEPCVADLSGDGIVNTIDLLSFLGMWGPNPGSAADFDGDGIVGAADLLGLLGAWGSCS